jgi:cytochrome c oxidase cbb3-type subunit 3/ubiquinol-cytochrome c reductase cytochrome c subunit
MSAAPVKAAALLLALGAARAAGAAAAPRSGAELYARMCAPCHGAAGEGYKADRAPALANPDFLASASDGFLRLAVADGRAGTTMSAWAAARGGPLRREEVGAVVAFVRAWERAPRAVLDERPAAGSAARGAEIYAARCLRCHGKKGVGGPNVGIGDAQFLRSASNGFLRYAIARGRRGTEMTGFAGGLGDGGIEDVLALLREWQSELAPKTPPPPPVPPIPLGPLPLNPKGPEPEGFRATPAFTPADAVKAQLERGARLALLDARPPSDYVAEHIAGAVSVPFYDADSYLAALPKDVWLVCYCACPHELSGQLARKLAAAGFAKATVLDEGFGVWKARGYATRTGRSP